MARQKGTGECEECGTLISHYAKRCKDCNQTSKGMTYKMKNAIKIPSHLLVRGKISDRRP